MWYVWYDVGIVCVFFFLWNSSNLFHVILIVCCGDSEVDKRDVV